MRTAISLLIPAALLSLCLLIWPEANNPGERHASGPAGLDARIKERAQYERLRLRDPATGVIPPGIRNEELDFAARLPVRSGEHFNRAAADEVQAQGWRPRGPYNVGGRTRAMAIDVSDENVIMAGAVSGGMWRSEDGGQTWTKTTGPAQLQSVTCIAQDTRPGRTNTWYYGTGELFGNSASSRDLVAVYLGDGLFKSSDGGRSWSVLEATATGQPHLFDILFNLTWSVVTNPNIADEDHVYAALPGTIERSTDGGASWTRVLGNAGSGASFADIVITNTGALYGVVESRTREPGIYRSLDGIDWVNIAPEFWPTGYRRCVMAPYPGDQNQIYMVVHTFSGFRGVSNQGRVEFHRLFKYTYLSGDGMGAGGQWEELTDNMPNFDGPYGDFISQTSYDLTLAVKPDDPDVVFIGGTNLYRSTDGFRSTANTAWIGGYSTKGDTAVFPGHHPDQHGILFKPSDPNVLYSANDGGVFRLDDALTDDPQWVSLNQGYQTTQFYTVALDQSAAGDSTIIGGLQDNGTLFINSNAADAAWREILFGDGSYCAIAADKEYYIAQKQLARIFRQEVDAAGSVIREARVDPLSHSNPLFINPMVLDPSDNRIMYITSGARLWRNSDITQIPWGQAEPTDMGWTELVGTTVTGLSNSLIASIAVSVARPAHRVYYGTSEGKVYRADDLHLSDENVSTVFTSESVLQSGYVSSIAIDPYDADRVLIVQSNYRLQSLFYTDDGGESWTPVGGNLEEEGDGSGSGPSCRSAAIINVAGVGPVYYVGTSTGLYSTDRMEGMSTVWEQEAPEMIGNMVVEMVTARQSDGLIVAATHGGGIYSGNVTPAVSVKDQTAGETLDLQVYSRPNPFREATQIRFRLAAAKTLRVSVFNLRGREVAVLANGRHAAGEHEVLWRGRDAAGRSLPAGAYWLRLDTSESMQSVLIVKGG